MQQILTALTDWWLRRSKTIEKFGIATIWVIDWAIEWSSSAVSLSHNGHTSFIVPVPLNQNSTSSQIESSNFRLTAKTQGERWRGDKRWENVSGFMLFAQLVFNSVLFAVCFHHYKRMMFFNSHYKQIKLSSNTFCMLKELKCLRDFQISQNNHSLCLNVYYDCLRKLQFIWSNSSEYVYEKWLDFSKAATIFMQFSLSSSFQPIVHTKLERSRRIRLDRSFQRQG